ncbi:hypothetical protein [Variovorax sp. JS1663]|uniref:hypothetical protein n=1 Tax=Variovorax sp. JS1663 TaxID=1851577 RepID=UPI000B34479D|nr:hypothetical protein [Variovorax sp. JS1663]
MTNASNRRGELNELVLCASCAAIQRNWRRAPGHAELVQMSSRKVERSDGDSGGHTVTITSYRCDACGTRWDYENDKTNQQAGWSVVGK